MVHVAERRSRGSLINSKLFLAPLTVRIIVVRVRGIELTDFTSITDAELIIGQSVEISIAYKYKMQ